MSKAHLILGETTDFITGQTIPDTLDERARQKIAQFLVDEKGYLKQEIKTRIPLPVTVDGKTGTTIVDFLVRLKDRAIMIIVFGPGSIVTRQRPALAAARLIEDYAIPYAVITNGTDAKVMDVGSGKDIGNSLDAVISKTDLLARFDRIKFQALPQNRREKEARILFAMDILTQKECDEFTCTLC